MSLEFNEYLRLEVETTGTGLPNLVLNPSGEKGAWFWITPVANTTMERVLDSEDSLKFTTTPSQAANFTTGFMPVAPTKYVASRIELVSITASHNIKIRYEWYDTNKAFLSSSTQSGALNTIGANFGPVIQAPIPTAYVKMRVDFYNGAGNPSAAANVRFTNAMVTWQDTGTVTSIRTNLVTNPSFETNLNSWQTNATLVTLAQSNTVAQVGTWSCRMTRASGTGALWVQTADANKISVTGGKDYTASCYVRAASQTRFFRISVFWYTAAGSYISMSQGPDQTNSNSAWTRISVRGTAPSNATKAVVDIRESTGYIVPQGEQHYVDAVLLEQSTTLKAYFDGATTDTGSYTYDWTGTAHASSSTEISAITAFEFTDPITWRNILGPTHEITIDRKALEVGVLEATILDALLDPAVSADLAPGKQVRLRSTDHDGFHWYSVYEGRIDNVDVRYKRDPKGIVVQPTLLYTNLVLNPSATVDATNWASLVGAETTLARTTAWSVDGTGAIRGTKAVDSTGPLGIIPNGSAASGTRAVTPNQWVKVSATVHNPNASAKDVYIGQYWYTGALGFLGQVFSPTPVTLAAGATSTIQFQAQVPASAALHHASFIAYNAGTVDMTNGHMLDVDQVIITEHGPSDDAWPTYFDGATTDDSAVTYAWTGTANASYSTANRTAVPMKVRTTIDLVASDNIAVLANYGEYRGVANIGDLPYILENKNVPWRVNGSGNQVSSATVVSNNDHASTLDQVALTRDTALGLAWVDRNNVLNVTHKPATTFLSNGTFDVNVTGWTGSNATLAYETGTKRTGAGSMKMTAPAAGTMFAFTPIGTSGIKVIPGQRYTISGYLRAGTTSRTAYVDLAFYDSAGVQIAITAATTITDNNAGWTLSTNTYLAPQNAAYMAAFVIVTGAAISEVHYVDDVLVTTSAFHTFTDISGVSYSDIDAGYNTTELINEVTVIWLRYNSASGQTDEITYGPYRNDASVATYGTHAKTYTIHGGTESGANASLYAGQILAANNLPVRRASSITVPIKDTAGIFAATNVDLYTLTRVTFGSIINADYRVSGIRHSIRADGSNDRKGTWTVEYDFTTDGGVAAPVQIPSPNAPDVTDGQWIAPTLLNSWVNFGGAWETAGYMRKGGTVYLRGLIKNGTITAGTDFFILPVGYRPAQDIHIATVSSNAICTVQILADGTVQVGAGASATWVSFGGIQFVGG